MGKKLKVYGWQGSRRECRPAPNGSTQTREICAATSWLAVEAETGPYHKPHRDHRGETGNASEIAQAMSEPFTVFWRPLNDYRGPWTKAQRAPEDSPR